MKKSSAIATAERTLEALYDRIYELGKAWDDCEWESFSEDECEECQAELSAEIELLWREYDDCREFLISEGAWKS